MKRAYSRRKFYVVKFLDLPFQNIDDYICVPHSWIKDKIANGKAVVAYPKDEDPLVTRDRVKRREKSDDNWLMYMAVLNHESDTYKDAVDWISTRNDYGPVGNESEQIDCQTTPILDRKLRSARIACWSNSKPENLQTTVKSHGSSRKPLPRLTIRRLTSKLSENAYTTKCKVDDSDATAINHTNENDEQSIEVKENPLASQTEGVTSNSKTKESAQSESGDQSDRLHQTSPIQSSATESCELRSMLEIDLTDNNDGGEVNQEVRFQFGRKENSYKVHELRRPEFAKKKPDPELDKNFIQEPCPPEVPAKKSKKADNKPKIVFNQLIVPRPSSRSIQFQQLPHTPIIVNSTFVPDSRLQETDGGKSAEISMNYHQPSMDQNTYKNKIQSRSATNTPVNKIIRPGSPKMIQPTEQCGSAFRPPALPFLLPIQTQMKMTAMPATSVIPAKSTTPAAQNLSTMAYQSRPATEPTYDVQSLMKHQEYLQYFARLQSTFENSNIGQPTDPRAYGQNSIIDGRFMAQCFPNLLYQSVSTLPQHQNQHLVLNKDFISQAQARELQKRTTVSAPIPNQPQFHCTQPLYDQQPYVRPGSWQMTEPQEVSKTTPSPTPQRLFNVAVAPRSDTKTTNYSANYPHLLQRPVNRPNADVPVAAKNIPEMPAPVMKNAAIQTTLPFEHIPQSIGVPGSVYLNPQTMKMLVDRDTDMDDFNDWCHDGQLLTVNNKGQTDEDIAKKQTNTEAVEDFEYGSNEDLISEHENSSDGLPPEMIPNADGPCPVYSNQETTEKIFVSEKHLEQARLEAEQDMLNLFEDLFMKLGSILNDIRAMFDFVRNSILESADIYEKLINRVTKFNEVHSFQIPVTNNPTGSSTANSKDCANEDKAQPPDNEQKYSFTLPAEYDPHDSRWTLKYKKKTLDLEELLPRSMVYVSKEGLESCLRRSFDCKSLARLLLTEVFSKNALAVCSLTGGKPKAFKSLKDVRPGLDEYARMVLMSFVEEYGSKRGWNTTNTSAIIRSIQTKIYEMRAKFGHTISTE